MTHAAAHTVARRALRLEPFDVESFDVESFDVESPPTSAAEGPPT
jgi:hypothetical protein